jgi:hypothetical protein
MVANDFAFFVRTENEALPFYSPKN